MVDEDKYKQMQEELLKNKELWMQRHNAVDITIGLKEANGKITKELCYKFWVKDKKGALALSAVEKVPEKISDAKTDVKKEEEYQAFFSNEGIQRLRPVKMGASVCNIKGTAGTTGFLYKKSGQYFILTNAHVAAEDPFKYVKDQVVRNVQPGPYHGGKDPADYIADMRYMVLLNNIASPAPTIIGMAADGTYAQADYNTCDCALIGPLELDKMVVKDIIDMANTPNLPTYTVKPGDKVRISSWRMNGVSEAIVTDVGKSSTVGYANGKAAMVKDLIVVSKFGEPGTSGSGCVVVLPDGKTAAIGLNFAGSSTTNLVCAIQHIDMAFGGEVVCFDGGQPPQPPEPPQPPTPPQDLYTLGTGLVAAGAVLVVQGNYGWGCLLILTGLACIIVAKKYEKSQMKKYTMSLRG